MQSFRKKHNTRHLPQSTAPSYGPRVHEDGSSRNNANNDNYEAANLDKLTPATDLDATQDIGKTAHSLTNTMTNDTVFCFTSNLPNKPAPSPPNWLDGPSGGSMLSGIRAGRLWTVREERTRVESISSRATMPTHRHQRRNRMPAKKTKKVGAPVKFPLPEDYRSKYPAVFCPAERILALYDQDSGDTAQRLAPKVKSWFRTQAYGKGWAGIHFMPAVQTNHGAGCAMWRPPQQVNVQVVVTKQTLVLVDDAGNDSDDE